ncbi:hypothetical protein Pcinc_027864 [Petrolisthes cinctipes]|uniref:SH3 domain-containing protein n=1 Tax=Petrolisthes cinctipes TaxID=88211 RepID=A0AAE1F456_PETCI|nr:hypothetical protein Pcinc_027864 [Petrolisthes cinctipes]
MLSVLCLHRSLQDSEGHVRGEDGVVRVRGLRGRVMVAPKALTQHTDGDDNHHSGSDSSLNLSLTSAITLSSSSSLSSLCEPPPTPPRLPNPPEPSGTGSIPNDSSVVDTKNTASHSEEVNPPEIHVSEVYPRESCPTHYLTLGHEPRSHAHTGGKVTWGAKQHGQGSRGGAGRGRYVSPPTAPSGRCHTEPPNMPVEDLLQVSWQWESRPARSASLRRRPSRRVSCRWKSRPRPALRRPSGCHLHLSPSSTCVTQTGHSGNSKGDRDGVAGLIMVPEGEGKDTLQVHFRRHPPLPPPHPTVTTSMPPQSLKRKWRHSDLLPRLLTEALVNVRSGGGSGDDVKPAGGMGRTRQMPLWMRRLSHLVLRGDREGTTTPTSTFYMDLQEDQSGTGRRPHSLVSNTSSRSGGSRRRSSVSPRATLAPRLSHKSVGWSLKQRRAAGYSKSPQLPVLHLTPPPPDTTHGAEDYTGGEQQQKRGGVLGRLLHRLRPPSPAPSPTSSPLLSRSSVSGGSEDGHSPSHSSDYEEQDDLEHTGSASLVGRMRGLRRDMQKKISRLKSPRGSTSSSPGSLPVDISKPLPPHGSSATSLPAPPRPHPTSAASYESLPSSTIPIVGASSSNRSSLSGEEAEPYTGPFIGRARALVDCHPSPYDQHALKFKKGDTINIIAKNPSGQWQGCIDGRVGHFKFILVEEEVDRPARKGREGRTKRSEGGTGSSASRRGRPHTLEELLSRLHLSQLIQVFVLNGYEDLDQFREIERGDLACLGITDPETCAKLLTAVALLHDADESDGEADTADGSGAGLRRGDHGRDSGCYPDHRCPHPPVLDENNLDTRQSTPSTDNSSGYHSRGGYNIPLGDPALTTLPRDDATLTLPRDDLPQDDPSPSQPQDTSTTTSTVISPPTESTTATETTPPDSSQTEGQSYRAHPATVLPASPHTPPRQPHSHTSEHKRSEAQVDFEAKFASARRVFERDSAKAGGGTGPPGRVTGTSPPHPIQETDGQGKGEATVAVTEVSP